MVTQNLYRPKSLNEIVGQDEVREYLRIKVSAAKNSGAPIGHTLFLGSSGAGKTTFAHAVALEMGVDCVELFAPTIPSKDILIQTLAKLKPNSIVFVDEIHALSPKVQEVLYTALEDGEIHGINKFTKAQYIIKVPPFTMIGATTHEGRLNEPLRKRFPNAVRLRPYNLAEMTKIIVSAAKNQFQILLDENTAKRIACVSQGTPRVARNLLKAAYEVAQAYNSDVSIAVVNKTLLFEELDPIIGLNRAQRRYLMALATEGQMGAKGLAVLLDEQVETIEFAIEPFLMQEVELPHPDNNTQYESGIMVKRTTKGRQITPFGLRYLQVCAKLQQHGWLQGESLTVN